MNVGPYELILIVFVSGLGCAAIARHKGRRLSPFVLLGIVFPVIGVLIALAVPPSRTNQPVGSTR